MLLNALSTRLFPKNLGADAYAITGIAARCDMVILSDNTAPRIHLVRQVETDQPRHIFVSMRSPFVALTYLARKVLPHLTTPFVLVTGSEDVTVPNQTDHRWRGYNDDEKECIQSVLSNPFLLHWFAENLDDTRHPSMSPLPLGLAFPEGMPSGGIEVPKIAPLASRPLRVLCAHRARPGPQWEQRVRVSALARAHWPEFCTIVDTEVSEAEFRDLVGQHAFVLCVEGGGLDPAPKAWQAMLLGAIPIIRSNALRAAYEQLPVAFVPAWDENCLTPATLRKWHAQIVPLQDSATHRAMTLERLGIDFWWARICNHLNPSCR